jgi:N-acetylgalactosamine-6-sulfatase
MTFISRILLISLLSVTAQAAPPNIVFILMDDLGYADLGCYGAKDIRTPHIDRLARDGVKFENFYSNAPVCTPTRCGFITGRWQQRVGFEFAMGYSAEQVRRVEGAWVPEPDIHGLGLPTTQPSIAKFLKSAGYATGAFGKWHLGFKDEFNPTKHGFDEYFGELLGHADFYRHDYYDGTHALRDGLESVERDGEYLTDMLNERATAFVKKHAEEPFFLYVPHLAVHVPWQRPDKPETPQVTKENMYDGTRADYAAMIERVDKGVGMILTELEKHGIADNTLIVLSSDNGGERLSDNRPLFHHKATLWEGGIHVPCVMRWPAKLPKGKTTKQVAITMDLTATFIAAAGAKTPEDYKPDGMNLLPILTAEAPECERTLFWRIDRSNRKQWAIRHGKWKYLNDGNTMDLLYDLDADIGERRSLTWEHPEIVKDLKARLKSWESEMDASERTFIVR